MARQLSPQEGDHVIRFGGGLNTRGSEDQISVIECADGQNFDLDVDNNLFGRRKPFDLVATATNGVQVRGFAQLEKQDGTLSTLVQAGGNVYSWDGASSFVLVGTCNVASKLRGGLDQNFQLDNKVIITDLKKLTVVKTWDGTTYETLGHDLGTDFFAAHCFVDRERAIYGDIRTSTDTPHLIASSARGDITMMTTANRPSSALGEADPWFLPIPDFRTVNGLLGAFGQFIISTERGRIFQLTGTTSKDFALAPFYPDSGAVGKDSIVFIGNDIAYVKQGIIESLFATSQLGDVETDDLSRKIAPTIQDVDQMIAVYCSRVQKIYFVDRNNSRIFVYHKPFRDDAARKIAARIPEPQISPWSVWKTQHASSFQPQVMMNIRRPIDGLRVCYFGGDNGEIFQMEGSGSQDGGTANLTVDRTSRVFTVPGGRTLTGAEGWIRYRKRFAETLTMTFQFSGKYQKDEVLTINLPAAENNPVYGGAFYYGGPVYYGFPFELRFAEQKFVPPGHSTQFAVKLSIDGSADFFVEEVGLRFTAA